MNDIEYTDGTTVDFPKRPGETLAEYVQRMDEEADAEYQYFKERLNSSGLGWSIE
jgi:hypothetical protein